MSFDIQIASRRPPTRAMVEAHLAKMGWRLGLTGDLAGDAGDLAAETRGLFRRKPVFILSGPHPAEEEDLPAPMARVVRGRSFLTEMNLPWSVAGSKDVLRCFALCEHLAMECDGAVYNPQEGALVFPDEPAAARAAPKLTPIRQLTLEWYWGRPSPDLGERFLEVVAEVWPGALPTRFGPHEPLAHKMADPDGRAKFIELWSPDHWLFFWKAKRPVFGGSAGWSPKREPPAGGHRKLHVAVHINASEIDSNETLVEQAVELFGRVANELGAFYGAGYITRGVLAGTRGAQWHGRETENFAFDWITGPWWFGLPRKSTWLAWYGRSYAPLAARALSEVAVPRGDGLLVRLGRLPMDTDQVQSIAPTLPNELVVRLTPQYGAAPIKDTGRRMLLHYERSPAAVIPDLG